MMTVVFMNQGNDCNVASNSGPSGRGCTAVGGGRENPGGGQYFESPMVRLAILLGVSPAERVKSLSKDLALDGCHLLMAGK
jgi:hypothetical protein